MSQLEKTSHTLTMMDHKRSLISVMGDSCVCPMMPSLWTGDVIFDDSTSTLEVGWLGNVWILDLYGYHDETGYVLRFWISQYRDTVVFSCLPS